MKVKDQKEVSCKAFIPIFDYAKSKNISLEKLVEGLPYDLDYLSDKRLRVEYSVWCRFNLKNRLIFSPTDYEIMGSLFVKNGAYLESIFFSLFLFSTNKVTRSLNSYLFNLAKSMFSCVEHTIKYLDRNHIKIQLRFKKNYEYSTEFFFITKGTVKELGIQTGLKKIKVNLHLLPPNAVYDIQWDNETLFIKAKRQLTWLFNFRKAFIEMTDSLEALRVQYNNLDESKRLLHKQTTQLETAHSLSTSVRQSLQMSDTLSTISDILTKEAGFDAVIINIFTDFENNQIDLKIKSENGGKEVYKIINDIIINDKMIGELIVLVKPNRDYLECKELLEYLMPVISIVIHDALVLRTVIDYRNNLEQKVISRTLELENARDKLFNSNEQLKTAQKIQNSFFTNISHEFRTPLTLILGPTKQLIEKIQDMDVKENLHLIYRSAKKLNRLVDELLDISKIETGEMKLNASFINLTDLTKEICKSFYPLSEKKKINFQFNKLDGEIYLYVDSIKFEKILNNLLSNAFKFTPEGGNVDLSLRKGKFAEILITDTGIGIPHDQLDRIFDRFYQVDISSNRTYEGTGIGLALTKELIELHKGKIEVESEEGKGSTFRLYFPLGSAHLSAHEICVEESSLNEIDNDSIRSDAFRNDEDRIISKTKSAIDEFKNNNMELPVLLVIEDNTDVRTYISKILESNYNICEAIDGDDGFAKSINKIPDLIISDIMMPKMDGFELCNKLKNDMRTSHIPIIMLTAKATLDDKINGLEIGADDYIMKPFDASELKARIKNLLEQRKRLHDHYNKNGLINYGDHSITSQDQIFLEKLTSVINQNIADTNFSVETLAENLAVSKSLLLKKTEALTGDSPNELIKRIRLTKAAKLLENNFGNISQIGLEVGFNNPSYFTECFKKQFGILPSQYRNSTGSNK